MQAPDRRARCINQTRNQQRKTMDTLQYTLEDHYQGTQWDEVLGRSETAFGGGTGELDRMNIALERGLSETATWDEIDEHDLEQDRREQALERGLADTATWDEIR